MIPFSLKRSRERSDQDKVLVDKAEIKRLRDEKIESDLLVLQTIEALASAIDAKDAYTNGHSVRVAEYSEMIAKRAGKDADYCEKIHMIGLLHDVGKIGVPEQIINKEGKLTDEEFAQIKRHPVIGYEILSKIKEMPELSIGVH